MGGSYTGTPVSCGASECERFVRDARRAQREEAHAQLDKDLGYDD